MNAMGPFLQSKFGKRKDDWVALPEVSDVLKHGLVATSAR